MIFKIAPSNEWLAAIEAGSYAGTAKDKADGFLHFSTAEQLQETLQRHYAEERGMLALAAVDDNALGSALKWEASRGGQLFPHLYANLPYNTVKAALVAFFSSLAEDDFHAVREFVANPFPPIDRPSSE